MKVKALLFMIVLLMTASACWAEEKPEVPAASQEPISPSEDPFSPPPIFFPDTPAPVTTQAEAAPSLQGIVMGPKGSMAIINNEFYKEGDEKKGIHILHITKEGVEIVFGNRPIILSNQPKKNE